MTVYLHIYVCVCVPVLAVRKWLYFDLLFLPRWEKEEKRCTFLDVGLLADPFDNEVQLDS